MKGEGGGGGETGRSKGTMGRTTLSDEVEMVLHPVKGVCSLHQLLTKNQLMHVKPSPFANTV